MLEDEQRDRSVIFGEQGHAAPGDVRLQHGRLQEFWNLDAQRIDPVFAAEADLLRFQPSADTRLLVRYPCNLHRLQRLLGRPLAHGGGVGVVAALLDARGEPQDALSPLARSGNDLDQSRLAASQRAGLVEQCQVDASDPLEHISSTRHQPVVGGIGERHRVRNRGGEQQRAWTGNNPEQQHHHHVAHEKSGECSTDEHDWNPDEREQFDCSLQSRSGVTEGVHLVDQPRQASLVTDCAGAQHDRTTTEHQARLDLVTQGHSHRDALARERGAVEAADALYDLAIDGYQFTAAHLHQVTHLHQFDGNLVRPVCRRSGSSHGQGCPGWGRRDGCDRRFPVFG